MGDGRKGHQGDSGRGFSSIQTQVRLTAEAPPCEIMLPADLSRRQDHRMISQPEILRGRVRDTERLVT